MGAVPSSSHRFSFLEAKTRQMRRWSRSTQLLHAGGLRRRWATCAYSSSSSTKDPLEDGITTAANQTDNGGNTMKVLAVMRHRWSGGNNLMVSDHLYENVILNPDSGSTLKYMEITADELRLEFTAATAEYKKYCPYTTTSHPPHTPPQAIPRDSGR